MENYFERIETNNETPVKEKNSNMKEFFWHKKEALEENSEITEKLTNLGIKEVHLEGVLEDWKYKITDSVSDMCEKYPEMVGKIGSIRAKELPEGVYACAGPTMNLKNGYLTEIQLDSKKFSKHNLEWNVVGMEKENMFGERWLAGEGVDGLIKHEVGHLMHLNMLANEEGLQMGEYDPDKYKRVYDRFEHNSIVTTLGYDSIKELGISPNDIGKELSAYGKKNFGELFAESISEYESVKKPRRLAQKVHEKYEDYISKQDGSKPDVSREIRSMVEESVSESVIPASKGRWENEERKGDSAFILDDDAEIKYQNKSMNEQVVITGAELKQSMLERYGTDRVFYKGNEPDFSVFEDLRLGHVELDDFSIQRDGQSGTFSKAEKIVSQREGMAISEVKQYMRDNNLTWHECGDCKTVRAIPTVINSAFKHTGGISIERSKVAVGETVYEKYGKIALQHDQIGGRVSNIEIEKSLDASRQQYVNKKKEI